jgi:uncharacterized membrane protein YedE/YeeE
MGTGLSIYLPAGLLVGGCAGFVMHRSDFCMAGAFRDLFLFRRTFFLKVLVLYWGVAALLFEAGRAAGALPFYPFPLLGLPSWTNLAGGALFGLGMVLAGGCVVGALYRAGSGSAPALSAVAGMVAGSALYAEIHPAWGALMKSWALLPPGVDTLPKLLSVSPPLLVLPAAAAALLLSYRWHRAGALSRRNAASGYLQPRTAALALAALSFVSWAAVGMPMGITTSYSKAAGWVTRELFPAHFGTLALYKAVPLSLVDPRTGTPYSGGPGPQWDTISAIQLPLILGLACGALLSALSLGELRFRWKVPANQYALSVAGGVLMGLASRMAPACNVWHLLGGVPILAVPSLLFLLGLFPGAWAGGRIVERVV